jgi:hypothetical protein
VIGRGLACGAALLSGLALAGEAPQTLGWLEHIRVDLNQPVLMSATLDTGRDTSALNADAIETFEYNDQQWVRFVFAGQTTARPVTRRILLRPRDPYSDVRWVVTLDFCIGRLPMSGDFGLLEREYGLNTAAVLGRDILESLPPINAAARFSVEPNCVALDESSAPVTAPMGDAEPAEEPTAEPLAETPVEPSAPPVAASEALPVTPADAESESAAEFESGPGSALMQDGSLRLKP